MEGYKTIAIFTFQSEYAVLRLLFDQAGIRYVFQNETMISVLPFHSNALGGILLKVHLSDIDKAIQIINDLDATAHLKIV